MFEQRMIRVHVAWFSLMIVLVTTVGDRALSDPRWLAGLIVFALLPGLQSFTTSGLERASIDERTLEPRDRRAVNIELARAFGATTLWFLLAASIVMAAGQLYVIVTDSEWWAWLGLGMFTASSIGLVRQLLLLRNADQVTHAS